MSDRSLRLDEEKDVHPILRANPFLIEAYDSYIPELEHKIYECIDNYFKEVI